MPNNEIPTLRGLGDELAGLPDLGKMLSSLTGGGDYDMQQAIKQAIAKDPTVADKLGQLSRDNPQLYGALKLGKLGNKLSQQPVGYEEKAQNLSLQRGAADLTETQARTTNLQNENSIFDITKELKNYQLKDLKDKNQQLDEQAKGFPGLGKRGLGAIAQDVLDNKNPPELGYIGSNQQTIGPLFREILNNKSQERAIIASGQRATQSQNAAMDRMFTREDLKDEKGYVEQGKAYFQKAGQVGTPSAWAAWAKDPNTVQPIIDKLVANPDQANTPALKAMLAVGLSLRNSSTAQSIKDRLPTVNELQRLSKIIDSGKSGSDEVKTAMSNFNQLGQQLSGFGGRSMMYIPESSLPANSKNWMDKLMQHGTKGFGNRDKMVLVDTNTHEKLDSSNLGAIAEQPSHSKYTPEMIHKTQLLLKNPMNAQGQPISMQQVIDAIKQSEPELYSIMRQRGDIPDPDTANSPNPNIR